MIDALIVSNLVLWVLVLVLAAVVLALVRQIGVLHERVAPAGALAVVAGPKPGEAAPQLEVETWSGESLRLGGRGEGGLATLLFFLSPGCPVCKELLPVVASVARAERAWLRVVLASDGPREEHEAFVREHDLEPSRYVLSTPLGLAYRVPQLPYAALVDEDGILRAAGLVNTREHLESLFEARDRGVASVQQFVKERGGRRVA